MVGDFTFWVINSPVNSTTCRVFIFAVESILAISWRVDAIRMIILAVFSSAVDAFIANRFGFGRLGLSLRVF
jgi:hypothetical protein